MIKPLELSLKVYNSVTTSLVYFKSIVVNGKSVNVQILMDFTVNNRMSHLLFSPDLRNMSVAD